MTTRNKKTIRKAGKKTDPAAEVPQMLQDLFDQELENLPQLLSKLSDKDRLEFLVKLLPYVIPPLKPVNLEDEQNDEAIFNAN